MSRPSREQVLMEMTLTVAKRGTCDRKQVGAIIERDGRPISIGYNGAPPGLPHCEENGHGHGLPGGASAHPEDDRDWIRIKLAQEGCRNATHAEANALAFAAKYGIPTDETRLFVTVAPCETCARLLIAAGIIAVYYKEAYRDPAGLKLLETAGVVVRPSARWQPGQPIESWSDFESACEFVGVTFEQCIQAAL